MTKREQRSQRLEDWSWIEEFQDESDRATAILGAAVLDALLEELLIAFFVDDPREVQKLLGVERPLGTFGSRSQIAFCLGLISRKEYEDLRTIGRIRNRFAHELLCMDFEDQSITDLCSNLTYVDDLIRAGRLESMNSRSRFVVTVASTAAWLRMYQLGIKDDRRVEKRQPRWVGSELEP